MGRLEQALDDIIACEPVYEKVCRAAGEKLPFYQLDKVAERGLALDAISHQEAELLKRAEIGRLFAINVDDFDPSELPAAKYKDEQQNAVENNAA